MGRPKLYDPDAAIRKAIRVFAQNGYAQTSVEMLSAAMNMGRQSIYDEFGDKWSLYTAAMAYYSYAELDAMLKEIRQAASPIDGIRAAFLRVATIASGSAEHPCLFLTAVAEFGTSKPEIVRVTQNTRDQLNVEFRRCLEQAKRLCTISPDIDVDLGARMLTTSLGGLKMSARLGVSSAELLQIAEMHLRCLGADAEASRDGASPRKKSAAI
jgi:AcrR family transcriptional regulator